MVTFADRHAGSVIAVVESVLDSVQILQFQTILDDGAFHLRDEDDSFLDLHAFQDLAEERDRQLICIRNVFVPDGREDVRFVGIVPRHHPAVIDTRKEFLGRDVDAEAAGGIDCPSSQMAFVEADHDQGRVDTGDGDVADGRVVRPQVLIIGMSCPDHHDRNGVE